MSNLITRIRSLKNDSSLLNSKKVDSGYVNGPITLHQKAKIDFYYCTNKGLNVHCRSTSPVSKLIYIPAGNGNALTVLKTNSGSLYLALKSRNDSFIFAESESEPTANTKFELTIMPRVKIFHGLGIVDSKEHIEKVHITDSEQIAANIYAIIFEKDEKETVCIVRCKSS